MSPQALRPRPQENHVRTPIGALRRRTTSIVGATAVALTLASTVSAQAAPAAGRPSTGDLVTLSGVAPGSHTITLITGDRVKLTGSGGHYKINTEPAPRRDGRRPVFLTQGGPDGVFVIPADAVPAVQARRLDRQLFNVKYLAENGYADDRSKQLPVIVQYPAGRSVSAIRAAAAALPASAPTHDLTSIHGSALDVPKSQAGTFWATVRSATAAPGKVALNTLSAGVDKIWLDQKVKADLDVSVPLIGAPIAWKAGQDGTGVKVAILDTGVDATHPDVADRIATSKSFVPGSDTVDGHGHGTHVASTIAGSGAASGGKYKGVAPGAKLVIGKVLDNGGSGQDSWIIDGMQWAASSGAKVVSMSLGGGPSDGTDPLSQAVDDLTAATGTLFVIAAGNAGPDASTVAAPGAADAALTVAATDKSDKLADFSSRGPRVDSALKPDVAAPGVNIVAARAAGTTLGIPVGKYYTTLSGTSMATPHVAGSAAILAERHPDWKAAQLKAALMSTAKDDGYTVYQQGAGRVDVGRADTQDVYATTTNLDYGSVDAGQPPAAKQVGYTNFTDKPVTLALSASLGTTDGKAAQGALTPDKTITVPANGTATTTVTLASADLAVGTYTGAVVATDQSGGVRLSTPVGLVREPAKVTLTIRTLGPDGALADPLVSSLVDVSGDRGDMDYSLQHVSQGVTHARVPVGTYSVLQFLNGINASYFPVFATLTDPEVIVAGDTTVTLDARKAKQITFSTPKPAEPIPGPGGAYLRVERTVVNGTTWVSGVDASPFVQLWASPTKKVTKGKFLFDTSWAYGQPEVTMTMRGPRPIALHPVTYPHVGADQNGGTYTGTVPFDGTKTMELVDVGVGKPENLAGLDLHGKLALLDDDQTCAARIDRIQNIRDAGAAGILVWPSGPIGICAGGPIIPEGAIGTGPDNSTNIGIPYVSMPPPEARALRDRLAHEPVKITVSGTPQEKTTYTYQLLAFESGRIPDSLHYRLAPHDLAEIDMDIHATKPAAFSQDEVAFKRGQFFWSFSEIPPIQAPATRRQYVGPLYPDVIHQREMLSSDGSAPAGSSLNVFDRPVHLQERWNTRLVTPGAVTASDSVYAVPDANAPLLSQNLFAICALCRQGDTLYPFFFRTNASRQWTGSGFSPTTTHLYAGGKEIPLGNPIPGQPVVSGFSLPKDSTAYRLTIDDLNTKAAWTYHSGTVTRDATKPGYVCVETFATLTTKPCRPEPLVFVSYDLGSRQAMDNTVATGRHSFQVSAYHSPSAAPMPKIAGIKLWYSTDGGAHWKAATLKPGHDGRYTATATYPRLAATTGAVSLKVEAWDTDGNRIEQTTDRAFVLRD